MLPQTTALRWESENRRYVVECQSETCSVFLTFPYPPRQLGEARRKAYSEFSKHVDSHLFPGGRAARVEREAIVRNIKRNSKVVRRGKPRPEGTYEPPPF